MANYLVTIRERISHLFTRGGDTNNVDHDPLINRSSSSDSLSSKLNQWKGASTVLGAILLHMVIGANQLGNIVTYMTSYLRLYVSNEITYSKDMWFTSITVLAFTMFTIIGGYLTRLLPLKGVIFIGVMAISLANLLTAPALDHSFIAVVLSIGFLQSAGSGMIYSNVIVISIKWFPSRRGLIAGLIIALDSIATFVTMLAQTEYINPDNIPTVDDYIIDKAVLGRVPIYFKVVSLLFMVLGTIGTLLCFMPPPGATVPSQSASAGMSLNQQQTAVQNIDDQRQRTKKKTKNSSDHFDSATTAATSSSERQALLNRSGEYSTTTSGNNDSDSDSVFQAANTLMSVIENDILGVLQKEFDDDDEDDDNGDDSLRRRTTAESSSSTSMMVNAPQSLPPAQSTTTTTTTTDGRYVPKKPYWGVRRALRTRMAMILFITFGLSTLSSYFIGIMAKPYGQFIKDDKFLALIISLANFANCVGSFVCGRIMDRIKFKHTMLLVNCIVAASYFSLIFCQYYQSKLMYAIWVMLLNFTSIGFFTSHLPEVMNKFGDKYASTIYGAIHVGPVISALVFSPLLEELIQNFTDTNPLPMKLFHIHYGYFYAFLTIGFLNFASMVILMIFYRTRTVI